MKAVRWLLWAVVAFVLIGFAIANRHTVFVSLDPLDAKAPLLGLDVPLFLPVFAGILLGIIIGGGATWWKQGKYRVAARKNARALKKVSRDRDSEAAVSAAPLPAADVPDIQPGRKLASTRTALPASQEDKEPGSKDERAA